MIHILGMSHAISFIDAFAGPNSPITHQNWNKQGQLTFQEVNAGHADSPFPTIGVNILPPSFGRAMLPFPTANGEKPREYVAGHFVRILRSIRQEPGTVLLTSMHGNEHSLLSMIQHPVPFDFVLPWKSDLGVIAGRQIIPYPVMVSQMNLKLKYSVGVFRAIKIVRPDLRVIQVMSPPPIPSDAHILRSQESFIAPHKRKHYGLSPLSIRIKYYLLYVRVLTGILNRLQFATLPPPEQAVGPDGTLLEPFWHGATHGNTEYGKLVLRQICELLKTDQVNP